MVGDRHHSGGHIGVGFRSFFERLFKNTLAVGAFLMVTGAIMLIADLVLDRTADRS